MPAAVVEAVRRYLKYRGTIRGPLFITRGNRGQHLDGRLGTRSVPRIVWTVGERIGLDVWCHGPRHSSITTALDLAAKHGMGLEKVKAHGRHRAIGTLLTYHDEHDRTGTQRRLADLVAKTLITTDK